MEDLRGEIATLEERIEALGESLERCRKYALAAKTAIGIGAVLMVAVLLGLIRADALWLMLSAVLLLGGIVLAGSNASTEKQTATDIEKAERMRAELISRIELTLVPEASRLLH